MTRSKPRFLLQTAALWAVFLLVASGPARAAEPPGDLQATIDRAQADYNAKSYQEALDGFLKAYEASKFPGLLFPIARCHEELGQLEEAADAYQKFLDQADAPPDARGKADMALRLLRQRMSVGTLVVQVSPFGAEVEVDGKPVGVAPIEALKLEPGTHELVVRAPDHTPSKQVVDVAGGKTATVAVALEKAPPTTIETPPTGDPTLIKKTISNGDSYSPWTWISLSAGAAAIVVGGIVYGLGESDHQEITNADGYGTGNTTDMTRSQALALNKSGDDKKLTGTILMSVGGAAVVTSAVLFLLEGGGDQGEPTPGVSAGVSVGVGSTTLTLGGRF